ncbi:RAM2 [Candida margitis]|uniref:RAM2 n=1 Tax=Candida margitis TaxID=1775924 RepID=UPI0022277760|nr:RAM2 [Candida margitis]KAI5969268.1 RAM2 [Candida margitis]
MADYGFSDVTPVELNSKEPQLCQILYDEEYKSTMGSLLALMQKKEYSPRALYLTELGIEQLASHYTTWIYRFKILQNLPNTNYYDELDWCEQVALDNEKNYQIWNYRQLIINEITKGEESGVENRFNPHREFPILEAMLDSDPKNHHVWSYRKWLVEKFDLFNDEKEQIFVDQAINADTLNNSAWSHRFFLSFGNKDAVVDPELFNREVDYVKDKIKQCPQNASSWNYLTGIYDKYDMDLVDLEGFATNFVDLDAKQVKSSFALELLGRINKQANNEEKADAYCKLLREVCSK